MSGPLAGIWIIDPPIVNLRPQAMARLALACADAEINSVIAAGVTRRAD